MKLRPFLLASLGLYFSAALASTPCNPFAPSGQQLYIGPEIYHVKRTRDEGAKQRGWLYGARAEYEFLKRYNFYFGADALWARGTLNGHTGRASRIKSRLTDENIEARFGYTFQRKHGWQVGFTPFIGWGYFWETNDFREPSSRIVKFRNHMSYFPGGFILQIHPCQSTSIYIKYKVRWLSSGVIHVTDRTAGAQFKMHYQEKLHYRLDVPIVYRFFLCQVPLYCELDPFYETRRYGKLSNFPFDFDETKFRIYGINLSVMYNF